MQTGHLQYIGWLTERRGYGSRAISVTIADLGGGGQSFAGGLLRRCAVGRLSRRQGMVRAREVAAQRSAPLLKDAGAWRAAGAGVYADSGFLIAWTF